MKATWKTKDGKIFYISEMETQHIKNCIRLIEKVVEEIRNESIDGYHKKTYVYGYLDRDYIEGDVDYVPIDQYIEEYLDDENYYYLLQELKSRECLIYS